MVIANHSIKDQNIQSVSLDIQRHQAHLLKALPQRRRLHAASNLAFFAVFRIGQIPGADDARLRNLRACLGSASKGFGFGILAGLGQGPAFRAQGSGFVSAALAALADCRLPKHLRVVPAVVGSASTLYEPALAYARLITYGISLGLLILTLSTCPSPKWMRKPQLADSLGSNVAVIFTGSPTLALAGSTLMPFKVWACALKATMPSKQAICFHAVMKVSSLLKMGY
jgi:hypothetical protein